MNKKVLQIATLAASVGALAGCSSSSGSGSPEGTSGLSSGSSGSGASSSSGSATKIGNASCSCPDPTACTEGKVIEFSPAKPTASFTVNIVAPGQYAQAFRGFDLDVSAFTAGGSILISGTVGPTGSDASFDLFPACTIFPDAGFPVGVLGSAYNIDAGSIWSLTPYAFAAGEQLFLFGATGNWNNMPGSTNTVDVTITVTSN